MDVQLQSISNLAACKSAVSWVKSRTAVIAKQHSLRAAVDAAEESYRSFAATKTRAHEKRK
jgi:hypothetical protein